MEFGRAGSGDRDAARVRGAGEGRGGVSIFRGSDGVHGRPLGAGRGGAARESGGGASRGGIYSRAGIDVDRGADQVRYLDGVRAGELARYVAAGDGQAG